MSEKLSVLSSFSDIINNFINKIALATGILYAPIAKISDAKASAKVALIELQTKHEVELINRIMNSNDISQYEKTIAAGNIRKGVHEFENISSIINVAGHSINEDSNPDKLDMDWLNYYFDKARLVSNPDMQILWGNILAEAMINEEICSKSLVNALSLISSRQAIFFVNISRFCFSEMGIGFAPARINAYPIIYFDKYVECYGDSGLNRVSLSEIQRLGLIDIDYSRGFIFKDKGIRLIYGSKVIELFSNVGPIDIGCIQFTYDGYLLYQVVEKNFNMNILDFTVAIWKKRGYTVIINGKSI